MQDTDISAIAMWITEQGLKGMPEVDLVAGCCVACQKAGLALARSTVIIDTLHPVYEGRAFQWDSEQLLESEFEYEPTGTGSAHDNWMRSAFFYLRENNEGEVRRRIGFGEAADFHGLDKLQSAGHMDYLAMIHWFSDGGTIGEMDCFYSHWTTKNPEGFKEEDLAALRILVPTLALAIKCISLGRIARTVAEVYLGQDAARQVLHGKISRGRAEQIAAVLWFSDLQNYTWISDTAAPEEIIPMLNDYSDAVISSIHEAGGDVLKLIGDGILAIFKAENPQDACGSALTAEASLRGRIADLNAKRMSEQRPVTDVYLGLHIGDVFYGNIGSRDRLDFTVIGPAVNEVSRIASMCRSADRNVLMSSHFVAEAPVERQANLVSVGRYALRGVKRAQELFTLMPSE